MKLFFEYGWLIIIPLKVLLLEFDFIFYLLVSLAVLFILSKLFLKFEIRFTYPDFFKKLDHSEEVKH